MGAASRENIAKRQSVKITAKQANVADQVVEVLAGRSNKTKQAILEDAGYSPATVEGTAPKIWNSDGLRLALVNRGVTPAKMSRVLGEAMDAKQGAWFQGQYFEDDAPDHKVRISGTSLLADILGLKQIKHQVETVNIMVDGTKVLEAMGL